MATEFSVGGSTSAGKRILQGARIPLKTEAPLKRGLQGKYSFEGAWRQATTMPTKPKIEQDPRWKAYFDRKIERRNKIIEASKQPGQLASERFLTETIDGIRMTPEQALAYRQKKADTAYEMESGYDPAAFRELLKPENISKIKKEYLDQLPKDRMWSMATVDTKYGGMFNDGRGSGFDQWFADNYLSKIKSEKSLEAEDQAKKYQDFMALIQQQKQAQPLPALQAPQEDYLSRGNLSYLNQEDESDAATLEERIKRGDRVERREAIKELQKTSPVFFNLAAFGNPWASKSLESFVNSGARRSQIFGPTSFRTGPGLGRSNVFTMDNYPTYGRSI